MPPRTYQELRRRFDTCEVCGLAGTWDYSNFLVIHHLDRIPSNNHPRNLQVLCTECHQGLPKLSRTRERERRTAMIESSKTLEQINAERKMINFIKNIQDACEICGKKGIWDSFEKKKLIFHHVDGDRSDNSPDNLMVVHAACHREAYELCRDIKIRKRRTKDRLNKEKGILDREKKILEAERYQERHKQIQDIIDFAHQSGYLVDEKLNLIPKETAPGAGS